MNRLFAFVVLLLALVGCVGPSKHSGPDKPSGLVSALKTRPDPVGERRIILVQPHTNEKFEGVYYKNGVYLADAMKNIRRLMRDQQSGEVGPIDPELIDFLVDIRTRLSLPNTIVFEVLSGYRTRASNEALAINNKNVAKESMHIYGYAIDFRISAVKGSAIAEIAKTMQRGGVSYYPSDNHVHVDIGNIRSWGKGPSLPPP